MGLKHVRRVYEEWGRTDPMYAVLTNRERAGGRWTVPEVFAHGEREISELAAYLAGIGIDLGGARALDFGSGVGRLSQALAARFDEVVGVDISESMIQAATRYNPHGDRVRFLLNTEPHLEQFDDASFDFVYSNITLQHLPPRYVERYIAEFLRVVRPGGLVVFQMRSGPVIRPGTLRAALYRINREHFRRFLQRLRGRPAYEIHFLARPRVEAAIREAGGEVIAVRDVSGRGKSFLYTGRRQLKEARRNSSGRSPA